MTLNYKEFDIANFLGDLEMYCVQAKKKGFKPKISVPEVDIQFENKTLPFSDYIAYQLNENKFINIKVLYIPESIRKILFSGCDWDEDTDIEFFRICESWKNGEYDCAVGDDFTLRELIESDKLPQNFLLVITEQPEEHETVCKNHYRLIKVNFPDSKVENMVMSIPLSKYSVTEETIIISSPDPVINVFDIL